MSVVLLSDGSAQRTSDEHQAFDLSAGRTLLPLSKTEKPRADSPRDPAPSDLPASTYLPASG